METASFSVIQELARIAAGRQGDGSLAPPLEHHPVAGEIPLTFFQEIRWHGLRADPSNKYFSDSDALRIKGPLDTVALERALSEIVRRHDGLRLNFSLREPRARVAPERPLRLEVVDVSGSASDEQLMSRAVEEVFRPVDVEREPLFRPWLFRAGESDHLLLLAYHQLMFGRESLPMLFAELEALYLAFAAGEPSPLPEPQYQFSDFARWQRSWLSGPELERRLAPWRERLARCEPLWLPTDHPRAAAAAPFMVFDAPVPTELGRALGGLAQRAQSTTFMILLGALGLLVEERIHPRKLVLGCVTNSLSPAAFSTIGMFGSTIFVAIDTSGDPTLLELLARVRESMLFALADQNVPAWDALPRVMAPVRDILVDSFTASPAPPRWPGLEVKFIEVPRYYHQWPAMFDLEWYLSADLLAIGYHGARFERPSVERFYRDYIRLLGEMARDPERPISRLVESLRKIAAVPAGTV